MKTSDFYRWDDLRILLAVHRRGSLGAAASALGVHISTVGRRLAALEAALGQHLFDRTPDGTRPTAAAEELVPHAELMERAALGLNRARESLQTEPEGVVRVTAPPGLVDHFIAPALPDLARHYPRLRLELLSSIGYADLTRREADLALRALRPRSGDLQAVRLGTVGFTLLASPPRVRQQGPLQRPDDLPWVTYEADLEHLPEVAWVLGQVSPERIVLRSNSISAQIQAVRAGLGVKLEARPFAALAGLAELPMARALRKALPPLPTAEIWLVGHRALRRVPRIDAVWRFFEERIRSALAG